MNQQITFVDIKEEDKSDESKRNHIKYYKSLSKVISDIQNEKKDEVDPTIIEHLNARIEAMEKDKKRISEMFPEIKDEE